MAPFGGNINKMKDYFMNETLGNYYVFPEDVNEIK